MNMFHPVGSPPVKGLFAWAVDMKKLYTLTFSRTKSQHRGLFLTFYISIRGRRMVKRYVKGLIERLSEDRLTMY